ncbi:MAG: chromosomal replication initiator protein DnaA [Mycoplasma sp.]
MNKIEIEKLWKNLIDTLQPLFTNGNIFESCILPSKVSKVSDNNIYITVPSIFAKSIFANDCKENIEEYFQKVVNKKFNCFFILPDEKSINNLDSEIISSNKLTSNFNDGLIKDFTLDNFVVGEFNKSAYSAVCAISKSLGKIYNPLFIYGSTGLGKTHLIMALGNMYVSSHPDRRVKYIDTNDFTRDVFAALSKGSAFVEDLKMQYASVDLLLIDDIQYLAGKEKTNEIFFNIFNSLIRNNKQIVITSDKSPEQLDSLEERMVSRYNSGLTLKIEQPESDVLKRIVTNRVKEENSNFIFQNEAIDEIVKYYNNDVRKLIGILNKISFYAIQNLSVDEIITKDFVLKFLNDTSPQIISGIDFNPDLVISTVCRWYGVKEDLVRGKSRIKNLTTVRHVCMYILRKKYNMPLADIGSHFSNRDHTTVMNAVDNVSKLIEKDETLKKYIEESVNKI